MGSSPERKLHATTEIAPRRDLFVVREGVRHVAIDILPREPLTFRAACGVDILADGPSCSEPTDCKWCLRLERLWVLVKATQVI